MKTKRTFTKRTITPAMVVAEQAKRDLEDQAMRDYIAEMKFQDETAKYEYQCERSY